jgi:hypothetical protein
MYYFKKITVMVKNFIYSAAVIALMMVSCTQNEMEVFDVTTSDAIALNPGTATTRATVTYLSTLQGDANGFIVYATSGAAFSSWYSDGTNSINGIAHKYSAGKWGFNPDIKWPAATTGYPMNFYAYYPQRGTGNDVVTNVTATYNPVSIELDVTIPTDILKQKDVIHAKNSTAAKPGSSNLLMNFKHALSKVNFTVTNSDGTNNLSAADQEAFILATGFNNLFTAGKFNIVTEAWNPYLAGAAAGTRTGYNYYNAFVPSPTAYVQKSFKGAVDKAFFTGIDSNLMLLPQNPQIWGAVTIPPALPAANDAYVQMMYRVENNAAPVNPDYIGYKNATAHPNYAASALAARNYTGPLFVKVGFIFQAGWLSGKGYTYNIPVPGAGGGRLLDEYYYDDHGNRTDLEVIGTDPGDPILGDGFIHLIPKVTDWDEQNVPPVTI